MLSLHYKLTSYHDLLHQLAGLFQTSIQNNTLNIPESTGSGFFKLVILENGLQALIYRFKLKEDLLLKREKEKREFYILVFDQILAGDGYGIKIESEVTNEGSGRNSALYLTSFLYDIEFLLNKEVEISGIRVLLTEPWMQQFLQLKDNESVLEKYINLKTRGVWYKQVDVELKKLLKEILTEQKIPLLFYQNKILRIIEIFFQWLYTEMQLVMTGAGINKNDIENAQRIEAILTNDITILPPTIKEMAKDIAMSESKLKKVFKGVYGLPPYEYFQKQRMQKARIMLLSGKHSIKDVGYTLGYSNLSNFTLAFKKEFNQLPRDVVKSVIK